MKQIHLGVNQKKNLIYWKLGQPNTKKYEASTKKYETYNQNAI